MTIIAPSVAPADTPSVSGEASGLRNSAWKTAPASAMLLPTSAAATTRGSRATKNTCASTLSANGIERSNARPSEIDVLPTSGASRQHAAASTPKPAMVTASRGRIAGAGRAASTCAGNGYHREMAGARVDGHVRDHAVDLPDV